MGALVGAGAGLAVGGVAFGAAAYCTTREKGKIGETARKVGNGTWDGMSKSKHFIEDKMCKSRRSQGYETVPVATVVGK